ncbi:hypothetical protein [Borreliella burgdorferi]|uniref:hypothetical protein n=1 Tax=Borreliella burgdorferi TaxID=139 RepID=UPI0000056877|nr:hypothetical protein [Borreliella burgdorferi]ACO38200.1 conserved hypothetical protein [Borreliella burgdorferi 29805]ADQ30015.1 conserved hypothetical protein [Borreliella burgdorferi N40]ARS30881.1 hypothetical protein B1U23_05885 [Borreliella burgdorferi]ARS32623.1 hypothetical protein B1U21_01920 [Borreliella burgdorferi]MCD2372789.1 hypothetical protein [Borreliella burgdorferi]
MGARDEFKNGIRKLDEKIERARIELSTKITDVRSELSKQVKGLIFPFYWILGIFIPAVIGLFLYLLQK